MVSKKIEGWLGQGNQVCDEYQQMPFHLHYCTPGDLAKKLRVRPSNKFHLATIQGTMRLRLTIIKKATTTQLMIDCL